jgi:hypothetical protein
VIPARQVRTIRGRAGHPTGQAGNDVVLARGDGPGRCAHHGSLETLSRGVWKNADRRANRAWPRTMTLAATMPASDYRWDAGSFWTGMTMIQPRNPAAANVAAIVPAGAVEAMPITVSWSPIRCRGRRAGRLRITEKQQTSCSGSGGMPVTRRAAYGAPARPRCGGVP